MTAAEWAAQSRAAQGLPETVQDVQVLLRAARLITAGSEEAAA